MKQFFKKELDTSVYVHAPLNSMEQIVKTFYRREEEFKNRKTKSFMKRQRFANRIIYSLNGKDGFYGFFVSVADNKPTLVTTEKIYGGGIESEFTLKLHNGEYLRGVGRLQGKKLLGETVFIYDSADWLYSFSKTTWETRHNQNGRTLYFNPEFGLALTKIRDAKHQEQIIQSALQEIKFPNTIVSNVPDYLGNFLILE